MLEKGQLYPLRKDGTKESVYLNIKNKRFLFGSSEYCTVRIYINGIFPEHCVLTIGDEEKAYLEPLHPSALTLVNGIKIKNKVCIEDNDVITIFMKNFQFAYPPNTLSRNVSFERILVLSYSEQMKSAKNFKILTLEKNLETSHPFRASSVRNINCIPNKQICIFESDILKKIQKYSLISMHQEPVNIFYENINAQEVNSSCFNKSLIRYTNQSDKASSELRRNLVLKLYGFISFLRELVNRREEYLYDLWPILLSVWKYCIARATEDILFLPLKSLDINGEITVNKKYLQSRILSYTPKISSPLSETMSEKENPCINPNEVSISYNCITNGQKQNQYSSKINSVSYKKRVSLAVKRYNLRKRKSIMMAKAAEIKSDENIDLSGEIEKKKAGCRVNKSGLDVVLNLEKQKTTRRKRGYHKRKKELKFKEELEIKERKIKEVVKDTIEKQNTTLKPTKEKQGNKKRATKKTGLSLKESLDYSTGEQTTTTNLTETKATKRSYKGKKKEAVTDKSNQEITQELSHCQRITRSMAKSHY